MTSARSFSASWQVGAVEAQWEGFLLAWRWQGCCAKRPIQTQLLGIVVWGARTAVVVPDIVYQCKACAIYSI